MSTAADEIDRGAQCFLCGDLADRGGYVSTPSGYRVTADIAPLSTCHLLYYSDRHILSFSELDGTKLSAARAEIQNIVEKIKQRESFVLLEHGPSNEDLAAGCCDHAHIHLLAVDGSASDACESLLQEYQSIFESESGHQAMLHESISILDLSSLRGEDYLWVSETADEGYALTFEVEPVRQILRRGLANAKNSSEYLSWDCFDQKAAKDCLVSFWSRIQRSSPGNGWEIRVPIGNVETY